METDQAIEIRQATSPESIGAVRALLLEYWNAFGFTPCFQGFDTEVASLPASYAPPSGRLMLATVGGQPAGCVALRPFDAGQGEIKRLYVRPQYRGNKLGRRLIDAIIREARAIGYSELIADTMPRVMAPALALYEHLGFERTPPYSASPTPEAEHIRLHLRPQ